ncbi:nitrate- and nitrite sensing domain-containing protein [Pseudonocardia sp. KRD291]|uniref:sensor histidine kinase n=1 Tax=Pseudonocardia sp. KRD291 TaxID=2792007 RepID=UPI001C4A3CF1|nr:nitrate- and nitrite sensing domain-containing protein [Pseudonocardia sp. KRD291]MBW0103253.1 nitrate- and nitrite sensing domain-containing protein [Pseudonocardia sp. KRD291]
MTSTEHRRTWSERLDPRNWSLVTKLAVVGLVPTILALTIGAVRVIDQANVAEELGQGSGLVGVHQQIGALGRSLQAERSAAVTFVAGNRLGDRGAVDSAQTATDQAVERTTQQLDAAEAQAPQLSTARRQAETTLAQLPVIRSQVTAGPVPALEVTTRYTSVVQRTLGLDRALLGQLQTADTAGLVTALGSGGNALEALELERTVLNGAIAASQLQEPQKALVNGAEASYQAAASDFQASLTPEQVAQFGNFDQDPANNDRAALRDTIMATPAERPVVADPAAWNSAVDRSSTVVRNSTQQAEDAFVGGRTRAAEDAGNTAGLNSVLLMLGLLLTIGIILLLGRQLVRSLRVLRTSALDVAERRLPQAVQSMRAGQAPSALVEPVPLESRDEIGQVARAFDAVHGQAIRLAADQAALQQNVNSMFVNLSRRSQALVERQLQLIEQLESNEQDPDQLSNLFQLDHLATRMRRNSENLLVLAGTDLAKRNVAPVQVVDVLRAAVSEVEQYQRVVVQTPPTATVAGRAANDLVHLLAELLDNATNFSPPDSQVVMSTTRTTDESLLIEIADRGVGMADAELSDANQRLGGPSEVDVSASRRMGLFVVGRLAARHRVGVRLSSASGAGRSGGLSASVTIPAALIPSAAPVPRREDPAALPAQQNGSTTGSWPMPAAEDRPRTAINGAGRNGSLPSMVAGTDGPMTPTFESGSGQARNGSAPKLPTRTPGSALRRNGTTPSTDTDQSPTGQETSVNGSAPGGIVGAQAFVPAGPRDTTDDGADMFTPSVPDQNGSGATGTGERPAVTPDRQDDPGSREGGSSSEASADDGKDPARPAGEPAGERDSRRPLFGAAAAAVGGAVAAAVGRRGDHDDRPADEQDATPHGTVEDGRDAAAQARNGSGAPDADRPDADGPDAEPTDVAEAQPELADAVPADTRDDDADVGEHTPDVPETASAAAVGNETAARPETGPADSADSVGSAGENEATPAHGLSVTGRPDGAPGTFRDPAGQEGAGQGPVDDADSETTALPVTRPAAARQPMGGAAPGRGDLPVRPRLAPSGRPVMPGGPAGPQRRPQVPAGQVPGAPAPSGPGPRNNGPQNPAVQNPVSQNPAAPNPDALFAPAVPVEGDRGQLRRPGGMETARAGGGHDIGQTTPIFEEIASAWFRSNRSVPVRWQDGGPANGADTGGGEAGADAPSRPSPSPRPAASAAAVAQAQAGPAVDEADFASPADAVWRQASAGADGPDRSDDLTSAGLPKRRPRARLLPGSAAGSTVLSPPTSETRSAENVRGRLASYQQGVRQGRESAVGRTSRAGNGNPEPSGDRSNTSEHEENT